MSTFRKADIRKARLRAALSGPSKSGKTFDSLEISTRLIETLQKHGNLCGNGRIALIDSEDGRAEEQYGDIYDFDALSLYDFSPETYIEAIESSKGYSILIVDQISHEWAGKNGLLEIKENISRRSGKNSFTAFNEATPRHNKFIDTLVRYPSHLIVTMRAKIDYVVENDEHGKAIPRKIGLGPVQRDSTEYEFDLYGTIDQNHILKFETRGSLSRLFGNRDWLPGTDFDHPGQISEIGKLVGEWICNRSDAKESGLIPREQIDELKDLGDILNVSWKKFFSVWKISSLEHVTPELYQKMKIDMTARITKREEEKQAVSV